MFSDAATKAIVAVVYLKAIQKDEQVQVRFVACTSELIIPRLKLCPTVLVVEIAELIHDELDLRLDYTMFYTDSKLATEDSPPDHASRSVKTSCLARNDRLYRTCLSAQTSK